MADKALLNLRHRASLRLAGGEQLFRRRVELEY
jgi:hypothetical protein